MKLKMWIFFAGLIFAQIGVSSCSKCDNCKPGNCSETDGCTDCYDGYYVCPVNSCLPCPENCATCIGPIFVKCHTCKGGYYGNRCERRCSKQCTNRTCAIEDGACMSRCPDNCRTCTSKTSCTSCKPGNFGRQCNQPCRKCRQNTCSFDGRCVDGCIDGYYQDDTACIRCPGTCSKCESASLCDECQPGNYGAACHHGCPETCVTCASDQECSECVNGYYGQTCEIECPVRCLNTCSKTEGACVLCADGYFKKNTSQCERCMEGCAACHRGDVCNKCKDGNPLVPGTNRCELDDTEEGQFNLLYHVVIPVGSLAVLGLIVMGVCIAAKYRRYRHSQRDGTSVKQTVQGPTAVSSSTEHNATGRFARSVMQPGSPPTVAAVSTRPNRDVLQNGRENARRSSVEDVYDEIARASYTWNTMPMH